MTAEPYSLPGRPRMTRLVLSKAGRRVVVLFIVLGILLYAGSIAVGVVTSIRATNTARKLNDYHNQAAAGFQSFGAETQSCAAVAGGVTCLHQADLRLAAALAQFEHQLDTLRFPANAVDSASRLRADTSMMIDVLRKLAEASAAEYPRTVSQLPALANRFDQDYRSLTQVLPGFSRA